MSISLLILSFTGFTYLDHLLCLACVLHICFGYACEFIFPPYLLSKTGLFIPFMVMVKIIDPGAQEKKRVVD